MAIAINKTMLGGRLTRDPEVRKTGGNKSVCNFGLAINHRFKGADGQTKDDTVFVDCECWGRTAELVGQYLKKGSAAFCEGRLKLDVWDDKEGNKRSKLKVVVDSVQFLGGKQDDAPRQQPAPANEPEL